MQWRKLKPRGYASAGLVSPEQDNLGGKVHIMVTGAAPISSSVLTFLRAALGCPVSLAPLIAYFTFAQIRLMVQITVKTQRKSAKEKVTQSLKFRKKYSSGCLLCICVWKSFHKWHQCSKTLVKQCPINTVPCQIKIYII